MAVKRAADGDYTPDPKEARFPPLPRPGAKARITLTELFERWQRETKPAPNTVSTWRGVMRSLRAHLGHEDAGQISEADAVAWKDSLIAQGRRPKTVRDSDLAGAKALFNYGISNKLLTG